MPVPTLAMVGTLAMSGHSPWIIPNPRARSGEGGRGPLPAGGTDCPFGRSEAGRQIQRPHPEAAERSGGFQGTLEGSSRRSVRGRPPAGRAGPGAIPRGSQPGMVTWPVDPIGCGPARRRGAGSAASTDAEGRIGPRTPLPAAGRRRDPGRRQTGTTRSPGPSRRAAGRIRGRAVQAGSPPGSGGPLPSRPGPQAGSRAHGCADRRADRSVSVRHGRGAGPAPCGATDRASPGIHPRSGGADDAPGAPAQRITATLVSHSRQSRGQRATGASERPIPKPWPPTAKRWYSTGTPAARQAASSTRLCSGLMTGSSSACTRNSVGQPDRMWVWSDQSRLASGLGASPTRDAPGGRAVVGRFQAHHRVDQRREVGPGREVVGGIDRVVGPEGGARGEHPARWPPAEKPSTPRRAGSIRKRAAPARIRRRARCPS